MVTLISFVSEILDSDKSDCKKFRVIGCEPMQFERQVR